ncbi:MAG: hypothetical protein K6E19_01245 [Lachnospiraceae bacterium]|nr:hypothetical protein [Lachnospiraceae bacterium]
MKDYSDIIDHPHYKSPTRPAMSMEGRAAQFAPFAALTGYDEAIMQTARQVMETADQTVYEPVSED